MSHLTKAIQNKVGNVLSAPARARARSKELQSNNEYNAIKKYRGMREGGVSHSEPEMKKMRAVYLGIRERRGKDTSNY